MEMANMVEVSVRRKSFSGNWNFLAAANVNQKWYIEIGTIFYHLKINYIYNERRIKWNEYWTWYNLSYLNNCSDRVSYKLFQLLQMNLMFGLWKQHTYKCRLIVIGTESVISGVWRLQTLFKLMMTLRLIQKILNSAWQFYENTHTHTRK